MKDTLALDFTARYKVAGLSGVAFYLKGYATIDHEVEHHYCTDDDHDESGCFIELETVADEESVVAVMVGDDYEHIVNVSDLTKIDEDDYCHGCGQIGCTADGR